MSCPTGSPSSPCFPRVLPMRQRDAVIHRILKRRFETVLPVAMRDGGLDMWLILCQEDNPDPIHDTMMPMATWRPILQILVLFDRGPDQGVERINLSMTDTQGLFEQPWQGRHHSEQWAMLHEIVAQRDPKRIGINVGQVQWAAGGLTHNLYEQLVKALGAEYVGRLVSAEATATRWASTLTDDEIELYEHVVDVAKHVIAECYSRRVIVPGLTTLDDLVWHYWQRAADLGLEMAFKPYFIRTRGDAAEAQFGPNDPVLRPGDFIRCDVGVKYLRLTSDHQQWAYLPRPGETDAPEGMYALLAQVHRLQDVFMAEFRAGLTGNELLANMLARARREGIPDPKIYSHSLGLFLHEPGPLIGLPWEQERCEGRGDVVLNDNSVFTMELSASRMVPGFSEKEVRMSVEEDVVFTAGRCRPIGGRQTRFHLI
ncbi:MAG: aminopeptidase P family protein [Pirellulales bacterium]|nr:aminopeptidase P family protein [Pirellulales bacterium]